jgi:hypothetical protein
LPDQRTELALGDLVSGEERYVVLMLEVLPLPLYPTAAYQSPSKSEELMGKNRRLPKKKQNENRGFEFSAKQQAAEAMGGADLTANKWAVYLKLIQSTSSGLVIRVPFYPKMIASGLSTLVHR